MHEQKTTSLVYGTWQRCRTCLCMCRDFTDFAHVQAHCRSLFCGMSAPAWGISLRWHGSRAMKKSFRLKGGQCCTPRTSMYFSIKYGNNFQGLGIPFKRGRVKFLFKLLFQPTIFSTWMHPGYISGHSVKLSRQDRERTSCVCRLVVMTCHSRLSTLYYWWLLGLYSHDGL